MPSADRRTSKTDKQLAARVGQRFVRDGQSDVGRVMAYADGYYMVRFKACMPIVVHWKEFGRGYRFVNG